MLCSDHTSLFYFTLDLPQWVVCFFPSLWPLLGTEKLQQIGARIILQKSISNRAFASRSWPTSPSSMLQGGFLNGSPPAGVHLSSTLFSLVCDVVVFFFSDDRAPTAIDYGLNEMIHCAALRRKHIDSASNCTASGGEQTKNSVFCFGSGNEAKRCWNLCARLVSAIQLRRRALINRAILRASFAACIGAKKQFPGSSDCVKSFCLEFMCGSY